MSGYHLYVQLTSGKQPSGWKFFRKYLLWGRKVGASAARRHQKETSWFSFFCLEVRKINQ